MAALGRIIGNQVKFLLENYWHAVLCAIVLALLPYTAWLSSALIALLTLRRGEQEGGLVLVAVVLAHFLHSIISLPIAIASVNTCLTFVPCYIAACILRITASWRTVAGALFLQAVVGIVILQVFAPEAITAQLLFFKALMKNMQSEGVLFEFINSNDETTQIALAQYLFGIQIVSIVLSAVFSLLLARSIQSQLFYPEGFRKELYEFRGEKISVALFGIMLFAVSRGSLIAMNALPLLMMYFFLVGMSLGLNILASKRSAYAFLLLLLPLILLPYIMFPAYVIFGSLDSLFNFRLYLPKRADTRI